MEGSPLMFFIFLSSDSIPVDSFVVKSIEIWVSFLCLISFFRLFDALILLTWVGIVEVLSRLQRRLFFTYFSFLLDDEVLDVRVLREETFPFFSRFCVKFLRLGARDVVRPQNKSCVFMWLSKLLQQSRVFQIPRVSRQIVQCVGQILGGLLGGVSLGRRGRLRWQRAIHNMLGILVLLFGEALGAFGTENGGVVIVKHLLSVCDHGVGLVVFVRGRDVVHGECVFERCPSLIWNVLAH